MVHQYRLLYHLSLLLIKAPFPTALAYTLAVIAMAALLRLAITKVGPVMI